MWKRLATASFVAAWAAIAVSFNVHAGSAQASPTEYQVKAAYLCNFPRFIEWPASVNGDDQASITLDILGKDPFGAALKPAQDRRIKGRKIVVRHSVNLDQLERCHIIFVSRSEEERLSQILRKVRNWNAVTISDIEGFAQRGGVINFVTVDKKIRFEINLDAAERMGLKISSKLLRLARIVTDTETGLEH